MAAGDGRFDLSHGRSPLASASAVPFGQDTGEAATATTTTAAGGDEDEFTFALSLLRSSCDGCWKKKCKCTGEMPCDRCRRAGVQCTYSTKRKLGRPRGATAAGAQQQGAGGGSVSSKRKMGGNLSSSATSLTSAPERVSFSTTRATGLGGLAESRFLACFLEHFTPMFPVADEVSIRDGLMYTFAGLWYGQAPSLRGQEALRARALECAFFSSVAIGGLLTGCPLSMVSNHVASAQASVAEFRGLSDRHAVSALVLCGMMNILLPQPGSNAEGRRSLDEAQEIFDSLPEKDPLVSVILTFRRQVQGLSRLGDDTFSSSPRADNDATGAAKAHEPQTASPNGTYTPSSASAHTDEGEAILKGVEISRGDRKHEYTRIQRAHPSHVVADALLLGVRYTGQHGGGDSSRLRHVHDYVASELNRLVPAKAGAMVLVSLAGTLLGIKTRLQLTDGMLPAAELTSAMLHKCPGWGRSYGRHAAHLSLAVFRLYDQREAYNALKNLVGAAAGEFMPEFDGHKQGCGHICGLGACKILADSLLSLRPSGVGVSEANRCAATGSGSTDASANSASDTGSIAVGSNGSGSNNASALSSTSKRQRPSSGTPGPQKHRSFAPPVPTASEAMVAAAAAVAAAVAVAVEGSGVSPQHAQLSRTATPTSAVYDTARQSPDNGRSDRSPSRTLGWLTSHKVPTEQANTVSEASTITDSCSEPWSAKTWEGSSSSIGGPDGGLAASRSYTRTKRHQPFSHPLPELPYRKSPVGDTGYLEIGTGGAAEAGAHAASMASFTAIFPPSSLGAPPRGSREIASLEGGYGNRRHKATSKSRDADGTVASPGSDHAAAVPWQPNAPLPLPAMAAAISMKASGVDNSHQVAESFRHKSVSGGITVRSAGRMMARIDPNVNAEHPKEYVSPGAGGGANLEASSHLGRQQRHRGHHRRSHRHHVDTAEWHSPSGSGSDDGFTEGGAAGGTEGGGEGEGEGGDEGERVVARAGLTHKRRPSFRPGSDFDFVWELGMLLEQDELSAELAGGSPGATSQIRMI